MNRVIKKSRCISTVLCCVSMRRSHKQMAYQRFSKKGAKLAIIRELHGEIQQRHRKLRHGGRINTGCFIICVPICRPIIYFSKNDALTVLFDI